MRRAHHPSFWLAWLPVVAVAVAGACGGGQRGAACRAESWQGQCSLRAVTRVRTIERFPRSFVVLEGLYEPAPGSPPGAPANIRKEFTAQALQEEALRAHLEQHPNVPCSIQAPQGAACEQAVMEVGVPAFQSSATSLADTGPRGCALIERTGVVPNAAGGQETPSEFPFAANQSMPSSATLEAANQLAARMKSDPRIECVALSGQVAVGEDFALADERARRVQQLLLDRGVEAHRVTIFSPTVPTYAGTSAQERQVLEKDRNVRATIVVYAKGE